MQCPKCKSQELKPTKIDEDLPALACENCEGSLLSLLYYRDWLETHHIFHQELEAIYPEVIEDTDTKTAIACPKCSMLMRKYSVSGDVDNRIDLCVSCDEAWLDKGEWDLLKSLELGEKLPKVFTEQWQKKVRSEKLQTLKIEHLRKSVGDADVVKAIEIKDWLKQHPQKAKIIQFIKSD
ncbi:MAG: zf-TFIIB domain-containing protein [Gammaproteobacteria bacterium]|nr:zf-TFIIB domain-containing protein [Gammaproteobacteria bacterium]